MNMAQCDSVAFDSIAKIRERIMGGADFDKLAMLYTQDTKTAEKGGDLGYFTLDQMVAPFDSTVEHTPIGTVSGIIKTQYGWHIVQVLDRRQHDDTENFLRTQAYNNIHKRKEKEDRQNWLRRIRDDAYVEIHLNN